MKTIMNDQQYDYQPEAGRCYGIGWKIIWVYFVELLVITIIYSIIRGPLGGGQWSANEYQSIHFEWYFVPLILFGIAYLVFVAGPITYSVKWTFLKAVRGEKIEIKDMFSVFPKNYWNAVIANIVVGVIIGIGFFMLIVPGIIFACRLAFVPYLVVDRKMDAMDAIRVSWDMTRGHAWQIFLMGLLAIPVVIAGLVCLVVGVIISIMWISTAFAVMYHTVETREGVPEITFAGE